MFFQQEIETMPREQLEALQLERLKSIVAHCAENSPMYKKKFAETGLEPGDIKTLDDVTKLPFTTKEDIAAEYPFGMRAVPLRDIVRYHASSGTTGKPKLMGYTKGDLDVWSDSMARLCVAVGITPEDTVQISFGYGLFTGALGLHYALEKIGCAVLPISAGNTEKQLMMMEDLGVTALVATPSYALYMSEVAREKGILDRLKLKIGLFGSEPCTPEMRAKIEENFHVFATDNYGMTELTGPGVSGECAFRTGLHINEDHFLAEVIDPDTGEHVPDGEKGELVVTALSKRGYPILRYRTRDITNFIGGECECGRTFRRMEKVQARADDMLIIKGVNVYPTQIESVLVGMPHIGPHYQLVVRREKYMDTLEVNVELTSTELLERYGELEKLRREVHDNLHTVLGIEAKVNLVQPKSLERFQGKAKRVLDLRNEKK